ncbi:MAG: type II toxin-antitoxin system HipA family toxin [Parachlamydiaceae bacterium]
MSTDTSTTLNVTYCGLEQPVLMGRLALIKRQFFFEYSPQFLELGMELSPFKLPLTSGVIPCEERVFDGLFGLFNDSLPDGWGRLLLDRKLMEKGFHPNTLTPLDRLKYVGTQGMGALRYEPAFPPAAFQQKSIELDLLAAECLQFQVNEQVEFIDDLLLMNGSSAGARPKILVSIDPDTELFQMTSNRSADFHNDWIIKFCSSTDLQDSGPIEYAYHLMAKEAGLVIPEARLFKTQKGNSYFGVKRFDRTEHTFIHAHTLSGLIHADHRIPSLDYEAILKVTYFLTKNIGESEKQFRNSAFNVFAYNRDDHAKNFSFLMDKQGVWSVSPAYDLIFSNGPGGEHCTTVMGNGKNPGVSDLLKLATVAQIPLSKAHLIIDQVKEAISRWPLFSKEAGVTPQSTRAIHAQLLKTYLSC